jgi:hypothetical protein
MQNHYLDIWLLIQNIRKVMIESHHRTPGGSSVNFSYLLKK